MRVIFDLDGTLIDGIPALTRAANLMLAEIGREPVGEAQYAAYVGGGARVQVERLLEATGGCPNGGIERPVERFRALYAADPLPGTRAYPGAVEALRTLAERGHRLGLCTQKPGDPARTVLRGLGLMPPIESLAHGDSLPGVLKPDPRLFAVAADPLGDAPVVYVGDSGVDAETARRAGVPFILTAWGFREPDAGIRHDHWLEGFDALPDLIDRLDRA